MADTLRDQEAHELRWVKDEGVHLTLKFLGNVPEGRVNEVVRGMEEAAEGIPPFHLHIQTLGAFPNLDAPRVIWVGIHGEVEPLLRLQARLEDALATRGFPGERRAFSPHLTLARVRGRLSPAARQRLAAAMESATVVGGQELPVHRVSLMESTLTPKGAVYARRAQISLRPALAA